MKPLLARNACIVAALFLASPASADDSQAGGPLEFSEHLIRDKYAYAFGVAAADLDGDGDLDLTSVDIPEKKSNVPSATKSTLYWFANDGRGKFAKHVIHSGEPGWFERHAIGDIDGDGRPDVAVVNNRDGQILWFANRARPAEGPWKRSVITTKCTRAYDVVLADFDADGDLDAAASGYAASRFTWYENPGASAIGDGGEWTEREIGAGMPEARSIRAGDFNGDGRIDLLAAAVGAEKVPLDAETKDHGSAVVWYENNLGDAAEPWKKHVIDERSRAPIHGHPVDFDGDGDLDVVMAFGMRDALVPVDRHEIAWYENVGEGKGHQWRRHVVGKMPYAFEAVAHDLDGDGDTDIAATAWAKGDKLVWFENRSGDGWTMHVVKENWPAANQLIIADLDGDKLPDIAATADDGSRYATGALELRWWRNQGRGAEK
jgi:hypothetical protein